MQFGCCKGITKVFFKFKCLWSIPPLLIVVSSFLINCCPWIVTPIFPNYLYPVMVCIIYWNKVTDFKCCALFLQAPSPDLVKRWPKPAVSCFLFYLVVGLFAYSGYFMYQRCSLNKVESLLAISVIHSGCGVPIKKRKSQFVEWWQLSASASDWIRVVINGTRSN